MCQCHDILCANTKGSEMLRSAALKKYYYRVGEKYPIVINTALNSEISKISKQEN